MSALGSIGGEYLQRFEVREKRVLMQVFAGKRRPARGVRYLPVRWCGRAYQESLTLGRTGVPSTRTAYNCLGSRSSACRIVGATWAVPTTVLTVLGWKEGLDSSITTLVSS